MPRIYLFFAAIILAIGAILFGPKWFDETINAWFREIKNA